MVDVHGHDAKIDISMVDFNHVDFPQGTVWIVYYWLRSIHQLKETVALYLKPNDNRSLPHGKKHPSKD